MILVFETHPIQYRVPVYRELNRLLDGRMMVAFASDFSVRGYNDVGFGERIAWDTPLLDGYPNVVLENDRERGIESFNGFSTEGISELIDQTSPSAILLCSFGYRYCLSAFWHARRRRIPVWIRMETSDVASQRSRSKRWIRSRVYRSLYRRVDRFFAIGQNNRQHYRTHGVKESKIRFAPYCTPNGMQSLSIDKKSKLRRNTRAELSVEPNELLVGFVGKLIAKKDPKCLLQAWTMIPKSLRDRVKLVFVGSGDLKDELRAMAQAMKIPATFVGFVNQTELARYYLAFDVLVLPSQKMGETWGLVVNEALQAGCAVAVSNAVGCSADFDRLERFKVFVPGDSQGLADSIEQLSHHVRDFDWPSDTVAKYSVESAATAIADEVKASSVVAAANASK